MATPNYFENKAFERVELVNTIGRRKWRPKQVTAMNLFNRRGAMTTKAAIEERGDAVSLIQTMERGAPASQYSAPKRKVRLAKIPHFRRESLIEAEELRDLRAYGSETAQATLEQIRNEHLDDLMRDYATTIEHFLMGALRGKLLDADGTELLNMYTFFEQDEPSEVASTLASTTAGEVRGIFFDLVQSILDGAGEDATEIDHIHCLASSGYMKALITSKDFIESVQHDPTASAALRDGHVFKTILWQDIVFEQARIGNSGLTGGSWVPADKAIFFPVGPPIYDLHFAPGRSFADLDSPGLPIYSRAIRDLEEDAWIKLQIESNPLAVCTKPELLRIARKGS